MEVLVIVQLMNMFLCVVNIDMLRRSSITVYVAGIHILLMFNYSMWMYYTTCMPFIVFRVIGLD